MANLKTYKSFLQNKNLQDNTVKVYLWHLKHFLTWLENRSLTKETLQTYYQWLLKRYKKIASINLRLIIINEYLKFNKNKFQFDLLSTDKQIINILTKKQIQDFLALPNKKSDLLHWRDKIILELLYYAGLKSGQLTNLKRDQINLNKNHLRIDAQKITLPEATKFYLNKYLNKRIDASPWLLINLDRAKKTNDAKLSIRSVERIVEKYARQVIPILNITPQTLRDTRAYHLKKDGGSVATIKDSLQFKTKAGAENYYKKL